MNSYKINMFSYYIYIMALGLKSKAQGIGKKSTKPNSNWKEK